MKLKRLLLPCSLLVALLFPGSSRAGHAGPQDAAGPRAPEGEAPGGGMNGSHVSRRHVRRSYPARTPPYHELEPNFKVVNCRRSEGRCQEHCNYMETQVGYCFKKRDACCLPTA